MWHVFGADGGFFKKQLDERNIKVPASFSAVMHEDSHFYLYPPTGDFYWPPGGDYGVKDYWALMQDDGNFCLKRKGDINGKSTYCTGITDSVDPNTLELTEMVYDFKNAIIKARGGPKLAVSSTAINEVEINQSSTLTISYTESTASGWKTSTTLKIGAKASMKVGVPTVAEGTVEVSSEIAQGWEWNVTTTKSEARTYSLPVVVPPGKGVIGRLTWSESTITLPFRLKGMGTFASGHKWPISINGIYEGVATHDLHAKWMPYTEHEEHSARAMLMAAPSTVLP
jgi:hypothetical protein